MLTYLLVYLLAAVNAAHAIGYSQVGSKLVASDGTSSAQFGHSVSMSDDGTIVVIGGNKDNQVSSNSVGATWVFTGSNGAYTQFGNKLVGTGGSTTNANQGTSVAISGDGTTILTGGTKDATFGTAAGAAWVFTLVSGAWTQQAIISPNVTSAAFGASVSLSSDGNTALIGSTGSASPGASWVYVRQSGTWTLQQKLVGTGNSGNSVQGTSVALSSDGKTAVIGGPSDKPSTSTIGATWVFTRSGSTWTQAQKLVGTGTTGSSAQGTSVAVNYNGTRIFIGATGDNSNTGAVWVFDLNQNGTWLEQTRLPGVSSSSKFGTSVATNREGDLLIIGASAYGSSVGAVYIYQYSGGAWSEVSNSQFQGSGNTGSSNQGKSVTMSKDGTSVCFGGDNDNLVSGNAQGAVWSFQQQTSTPTTYTPTYSPTSLAPTSGGVARTSYIYEKLIDYNSVFPNYLQQQRWTEKTTDAFTFFKADPFLFFLDMGQDSRLTQFGTSQTRTWISGDQHLDNFGTFHNDQSTIVYDYNDFDNAVIADYQLDLWRCAVSLLLTIQLQYPATGTMTPTLGPAAIDQLTAGYYDAIQQNAGTNNEVTFTMTATTSPTPLPPLSTLFAAKKGTTGTRAKMLNKVSSTSSGTRVLTTITTDPTAAVDGCCTVPAAIRSWMIASLPTYGTTLTGNRAYDSSYFAFKDMCQRLQAGGGSMGVLRFYVLIEGPSSSDQDDDILLEVKQQPGSDVLLNMDSTLKAFNEAIGTSAAISIHAYRRLVNYADDFMGTMTMSSDLLSNYGGVGDFTGLGNTFSVRERSPNKNSYGFDAGEDLTTNALINQAAYYMGEVMAMAHSRADNDSDSTYVPYDFDSNVLSVIEQDVTSWKALVKSVAEEYTGQVNSDYQSYIQLYNSGAFAWTNTPTNSPSRSPSKSPSKSPSRTPSRTPSKSPSKSPTRSPSKSPSRTPTKSPSKSPSRSPSKSPSRSPTKSPTRTPSKSPSRTPSRSPSKSPTHTPSRSPSRAPSRSPSRSPTRSPSKSPSRTPSRSPSKSPTRSPSKSPSRSPTKLKAPTKSPSQSPSRTPSRSPSRTPSRSPSRAPTKSPVKSKAPTQSPSRTPSRAPSRSPTPPTTRAPTRSPTRSPSRAPTAPTTRAPTRSPTRSPSRAPTQPTTRAPTRSPTRSPSLSPTTPTTRTPSRAPSKSPSQSPIKTTKPPSHSPSRAPTTGHRSFAVRDEELHVVVKLVSVCVSLMVAVALI